MPQEWFIRTNQKTYGPFDSTRLKQLADAGKIDASTEISRSAAGPWGRASGVKGLFADTRVGPSISAVPNGNQNGTDESRFALSKAAGIGMASVIFGGFSIIAALIPPLNIATAPAAAMGLVFGATGLWIRSSTPARVLRLSSMGVFTSVLGLLASVGSFFGGESATVTEPEKQTERRPSDRMTAAQKYVDMPEDATQLLKDMKILMARLSIGMDAEVFANEVGKVYGNTQVFCGSSASSRLEELAFLFQNAASCLASLRHSIDGERRNEGWFRDRYTIQKECLITTASRNIRLISDLIEGNELSRSETLGQIATSRELLTANAARDEYEKKWADLKQRGLEEREREEQAIIEAERARIDREISVYAIERQLRAEKSGVKLPTKEEIAASPAGRVDFEKLLYEDGALGDFYVFKIRESFDRMPSLLHCPSGFRELPPAYKEARIVVATESASGELFGFAYGDAVTARKAFATFTQAMGLDTEILAGLGNEAAGKSRITKSQVVFRRGKVVLVAELPIGSTKAATEALKGIDSRLVDSELGEE